MNFTKRSHDRIILGENAVYSTDSEKTQINNNVLICAASGAGKTVSIVEPNLIETYQTCPIVTVTKRRIVDKYAPIFVARGYQVLDLNFVNPSRSGITFDPICYVNTYKDITFLAESVVMSNPRKENSTADPFWDENSVLLMAAMIAYVKMSSKNPSFSDALDMCSNMDIQENGSSINTNLDEAFERLARKDPNCYAVTCWKSFRNLPIKTASCILSTLKGTIDRIFTPELRGMMKRKDSVDFIDFSNKKSILFVTTSAVNPAMNCFVNMFYAEAIKQLFEYAESRPDGKLPRPVRIIADDFATGSKILDFPEYISIFREKDISVTLLIQSDSQLEALYGSYNAVTIRNNCDTYVFMGSNDLGTARAVSERVNLPLEDILYMPIGKEIIFRRGQKPIITERYNIKENIVYKEVTKNYENSINKKLTPKPQKAVS